MCGLVAPSGADWLIIGLLSLPAGAPDICLINSGRCWAGGHSDCILQPQRTRPHPPPFPSCFIDANKQVQRCTNCNPRSPSNRWSAGPATSSRTAPYLVVGCPLPSCRPFKIFQIPRFFMAVIAGWPDQYSRNLSPPGLLLLQIFQPTAHLKLPVCWLL